ncbi:putative QWRF family protein [Helianthus debilis subsp. tardiflorus]
MMVAAVSETTTRNHTIRPSLLPTEKDDDVITPVRPKSRQVSSRYLSPSTSNSNSNSNSLRTVTPSRRAPSPLISRNSTTPVSKRSLSVDRRRPTRPDLTLKPNNAGGGGGGELSAADKLLVTSTRSLSVSFQGEAFSLPISKTKITQQSPNLIRKGTPERKRIPTLKIGSQVGDHVENTKPMDHHRWPSRIRQPNATVLSKGSGLDCEDEKGVVRDFKLLQSLDSRRASFDGCRSNLDLGNSSGSIDLINPDQHNPDRNLAKDSYSDTDSVSSGSTSGIQENGLNRSRIGRSGIIVSPKFWQETNSRMRRLQDPSSPLSTSPGSKSYTPQKNFNSKRFSSDNFSSSSPKTMASPNRMRPSSPSKVMMTSPLSSQSRGMISPRRNSVCGISNNVSDTPSVLSFAVDVRRGKVGENRFFDAHVLRLLYNRQLQWRFVNARTEDIVLKQKHSVEENLWNAWITMADLRDSVTKKRHRLQLLRQKLKLASILKTQMVFLEDWAYLDKDHSISLLGAIEALKASTLRLPVGAGATADLQSMKDAINSALDVMQAMVSSTNTLCLQVEEVNLMVTEIAKVSAKERALLRICKDFLSVLSALKVKDSSLRTHMIQTSRVN